DNTLHRNGNWVSSKVGIEYGILGSVAFLTTRTALNRERLNLGVWHKFHEVVHRRPLRLAALDLDFRLRRAGYLVVLFQKDAEGFAGIRLSRNPDFPTACLIGDAVGEFSGREPLIDEAFDDGWHHLRLRLTGDRFSVTLNERSLGTCARRHGDPASVGLRGSGAKHIYVDNVVLEDVDGTVRVSESFGNTRSFLASGLVCLALVALVYAAVLIGTRANRRRTGRRVDPYLALTHLVLLVPLGLALGAERYVLGRRHHESVNFYDYPNRIEDEADVLARLAEVGERPKNEGTLRILFVGGSQTWGSGARSRRDTWFERLEAKLNADPDSDRRVECLSAGIPAYTVPQLLALYESHWRGLEPDVVVINVGNNDVDMPSYRKALEGLVDLTASLGVRTVLVPEANTTQNRRSIGELYARHEAMREVARERGLPLIETHSYLDERRDTGFLWWDRVHLAPYGQELLARRFYEQRAILLGED
ncbi:MAG: SGNH/GDSL hydrolase family protein, partial [Myxococcales bacterium]|nr:SGNH/GDSL hydrolase family protein [Myxococcales bacterium]